MMETFIKIYAEELEKAVVADPEVYAFKVDFIPTVVERMKAAFEKGSYNKEGHAIKATCKRLNIPCTKKGINNYLAQQITNS